MENTTSVETQCTSCHAVYAVPAHLIGKRVSCGKCGHSFEMTRFSGRDNDLSIGKLALKYKLISERQFKDAVSVFKETRSPERHTTLEDVLADQGLLSSGQIRMLCDTRDFLVIRQKDKRRGERLVERGLCTQSQVEQALVVQTKLFKNSRSIQRIDDILSNAGILDATTEEDRLSESTSVASDLRILGDIEPAAEPVCCTGHIIVSGSIKPGVTIKGGRLTAREITGAEIEVEGNVSVDNGIVDTRVRARGDIRAKYIKNADILTYGDVAAEKEIIHSEISASGACSIENGTILSSVISARKGIFAGDVGADLANPSTLRPGVDAHAEKELERIQLALEEKNEILEKLKKSEQEFEQTHDRLHQEIADLAQIGDRSLLEHRSLKEKMDVMIQNGDSAGLDEARVRLKELENSAQEAEASLTHLFDDQEAVSEKTASILEEISGVQTELLELQTGYKTFLQWVREQKSVPSITVQGEIFEGTIISGLHTKKVLPKNYKHVLITETRIGGAGGEDKWDFRVHPREKEHQHSHRAQLHGV